MTKKYKELKYSDVKVLKKELHVLQEGICPVMNQEFEVDDMCIDHQHKKKADPVGLNGGGLVRGCIHKQANVLEGKITNTYIRYGLHKFIPLPELLRNLADYLERENLPIVHPTERERPAKLTKRSYNKLLKAYENYRECTTAFPNYPRSGKLTKPLEKWYKRLKIEPEFYK